MTIRAIAVRVIAVHVECRCCGGTARIQNNYPDGFTRHILQPLASWWASHRDPKLVLFVVTANGVPQEWPASYQPPDERPSP